MKKQKIFLILFLFFLNIDLVKSFAISPGIINVDFQPNKTVNLSFKIINIENESIKIKFFPSNEEVINIIKEIEIKKEEKEKQINFTLYMEKNLEDKIYIFIIQEEELQKGISVKKGIKLIINLEKRNLENYNKKELELDKKIIIKKFLRLIIYGFYLEIIQKI